jgi:Ca2+-binding RTX toxin-like protein
MTSTEIRIRAAEKIERIKDTTDPQTTLREFRLRSGSRSMGGRRPLAARPLLGLAGALATLAAGFGFTGLHPESAAAKSRLTAKIHDSTLIVTGTDADDTIILRLRAGDPSTLEVAVGGTKEFEFALSKFQAISVSGAAGDDVITMDESNGAIRVPVTIDGGDGNDTVTGGSGNDTIRGGAGNDIMQGAAGNDTMIGGPGTDSVSGGAGDDRMVWNAGDGTDFNEGGDGVDTVEVNGSDSAEVFTMNPNGTRVRFDRTDPAPFSLDIGSSEQLVLNANGGDDTFTAANGLAPLIQLTVDGGAGNDTVRGGDGNDLLLGGDGNDFIDGNRGSDVVLLGAGDDVFQWDPGDGSDTVEGQAGSDTMLFNGANVGEQVDLSANGQRLRFTRDVASIVMDLDGVEIVHFNALGGADQVTVNDLAGTAVSNVEVNLAAAGGVGDGAADNLIVNGTGASETITVAGDANGVTVSGLAAQVVVTGAEAANDRLTINALGGADVVSGSGLVSGAIQFTASGGDGDDVLIGGAGDDVLVGGAGDDVLEGGPGQDVLDGGPGNNTVIQ